MRAARGQGGLPDPGPSRDDAGPGTPATVERFALAFAAIALLYGLVVTVARPASWVYGAIAGTAGLLLLVAAWLARRGARLRASGLLVAITWVAGTVAILAEGGVDGPAASTYLLAVAAAGMLVGLAAAALTAGASVVALAVFAVLDVGGILGPPWLSYTPVTAVVTEAALLAVALALLVAGLGYTQAARGRAAESEARRRLVEENALDLIWTSDARGRTTFASAASERLLGWTPEEQVARGATIAETLTRESARRCLAEVAAAVAEGREGVRFDAEHLRRDGGTVWCETQVRILRDARGAAAGFVGVTRDASVRRAAEERQHELEARLRESAKMEAIGKLAGGVAHDFNNYLTVILGFADELRDALPDGDERIPAVDAIVESAEHSAELTRQLLAFGRRQVMQPRVLELDVLVQGLEPLLRRLAGPRIRVHVVRSAGAARVLADPAQLEQVVLNLAVNARDAMPDGGRLQVETDAGVLDAEEAERFPGLTAGPYVRLRMSDTGMGMDPEVRERIFEPFFTTKQSGEGSGLGLSSVHGILHQSGGAIDVETAPGKGTTFEVRLPAVEGAPAEPAAEALRSDLRGGDETILLVEDDGNVRALARAQLASAGYTVLDAPDAPHALARAEAWSGPIHLLVTDVVMPGPSGVELAESVRAARPAIRVLFMSGFADRALAARGHLEESALVRKPFTRAALLARVREALDAG